MAEAIVSIVMHKLVSTIQLELEQQVRQVAGVQKQVSKITKTLVSIKPLLHDAEMKQFGDSTVQEWLETLRDVMYDAELVLDDWNTLIHTGATPAKVRSYVSWFHRSVPGSDIALRIKGIRKRLSDIVHDKAELDLTLYQAREDGVHSSIVEVPEEIYGRELDKRLILSKILAQGSHQETHIGQVLMYILGMGGLGKTTLAQLVFNDEEVKTYFECKIWVSISEPFHVERVAKEIIEQASGEDVENGVGWEVLNRRLLSSLEDKRFLLVLDGFGLTESLMDWTPLKPALNSGAIGSRIIITASSQRVAGSSNDTQTLTESEHICLNLFRHIAFWGRSEQEVGKLEEIGVEIASKCGGIPLAAKMVASLMRFKHTAAEWRSVLQSDLWELGEIFFPALLLSYHALPPYLKLCFMYTAIFPKGTRLEKDRLVKLWMAQSFAVSDGRKEPEMIAGEFFDALVTRSIFQDFEKDVDGNITSCRMHDFLHDLAESLTENECHIMKRNDSIDLTNSKVRHLNALHIEGSSVFMGKGLRTLILNVPVQFLRDTFLQCTSLRALDLHGSDLIELPEEIDRLLHLRYLDLSDTRLSILPATVCNLYNLQTLKLNSCGELIALPEGIGGLSNLRHLEIKETPELTYFPESIGRLSHLRTLWKFLVSDESGGCKLGELRYLNDLAGSLAILRLWQVEDGDESRGAHMLKKKDLRSLHLHFGFFWEGRNETEEEDIMRMESVIEGLQPNANLGKLLILSYPGFTFPFWMSSKSLLCNVVNIELWDCGNCIQLPALGYLESLEIINIGNFNCVKQIGAEFYGSGGADDTSFPKLKTLSIDGFPELEDWEIPFWKFKKVMPYLCNLELKRCGMLMGAGLPELGRLESLEELRIYHLDSLRELGPGFLGISADDGREGEQQTVVFPKLKRLELNRMDEWEEEHWPYHQEKKNETLQIMPNLSVLWIVECPKLQVVPPYMFADSLIGIELNNCPKLARVPCLPPLLQQLKLNGDVGVISTSLIPFSSDHHDYANLRTVEIHHSPLSSLPPGLSKFTSLQQLDIRECEFLDLNPLEELRHFTMLQNLLIHNCEVITQRFFREDWTKTLLSRTVYSITIHVA